MVRNDLTNFNYIIKQNTNLKQFSYFLASITKIPELVKLIAQ